MMAGFTKRLDNDDVVDADDTPSIEERRRRYCLELAINSAPAEETFSQEETLSRAAAYDEFLRGAPQPETVH